MNRRQTLLAMSALSLAGLPTIALADDALKAAIAGAHRSPNEKARDQYRKPEEVLTFWGLKPGMTVVEISPGSGYWLEILAPYAKATNGKYFATGAATPFQARIANPAYGTPNFTGPFNLQSGPLVPAGSADMVLTARNIHNWMWQPGMLDKAMKDFHAALKPGGILAVEEHRADPRPETVQNGRAASDGYVSTKTVVDAATKAGFRLAAESEVLKNPRDTKDHPGGVWTLPPNSRQPNPVPAGFDAAKYKAIGESDRMALRFVKA
jgi:predicted methyltransferase